MRGLIFYEKVWKGRQISMKLYADAPISKGVENALKRAKQMTELKWTPVARFPTGMVIRDKDRNRVDIDMFTEKYCPQKGVNYSSVRCHEKFVGDNVLFETYVSAISNPRSVVYTRSQHGNGRAMYNFYGTVCSSFAAYVLHLPVRFPCSRWTTIPGVTAVDTTTLEALQLCDVLLSSYHIAVITGIQRDVDGIVRQITVSEGTTPVCKVTRFTPEEFRGYWLDTDYKAYRYAGVHDVPYTPDPFSPVEGDPVMEAPAVNRTLQPDYGNKANYMLGDTVELQVLEDGWESVEITGAETVTLPVDEGRKAAFTPAAAGYYTACCVSGGRKSASVEFRITDMEICGDKTVYQKGETMALAFRTDPADKALGWIVHSPEHFWRAGKFLSDEEIAAGKTEVPVELPVGEHYVFVMAEGAFGRYRSPGFFFRVEE